MADLANKSDNSDVCPQRQLVASAHSQIDIVPLYLNALCKDSVDKPCLSLFKNIDGRLYVVLFPHSVQCHAVVFVVILVHSQRGRNLSAQTFLLCGWSRAGGRKSRSPACPTSRSWPRSRQRPNVCSRPDGGSRISSTSVHPPPHPTTLPPPMLRSTRGSRSAQPQSGCVSV